MRLEENGIDGPDDVGANSSIVIVAEEIESEISAVRDGGGGKAQ